MLGTLTLAANSRLTQISRVGVSAPTRMLVDDGFLQGPILHHGAGRAEADTKYMELVSHPWTVTEYDPHAPRCNDRKVLEERYHCVVSNYVLNVLPRLHRGAALGDIARCTSYDAFITVRGVGDRSIKGIAHEDGVITSRGTFQKGYTKDELVAELSEFFRGVEIIHGGRGRKPATLTARCWGPR